MNDQRSGVSYGAPLTIDVLYEPQHDGRVGGGWNALVPPGQILIMVERPRLRLHLVRLSFMLTRTSTSRRRLTTNLQKKDLRT